MKEMLFKVVKQTKLEYLRNGNAKFLCKSYVVLYNGKLKRWTCTCKGFVKSGGKNVCKHISASALILSDYSKKKCPLCEQPMTMIDSKTWHCNQCMEDDANIKGGIKNETGNAELQANQSD